MAGAPWRKVSRVWEIAPGRGRKATYRAKTIVAIVEATLHSYHGSDALYLSHDVASAGGASSRSIVSGPVTR